MALTKRLVKGTPLTAQEHDDNLDHVLNRANGTGTQTAATISDLSAVIAAPLAGKVDKIPGRGLSTEDYTTAEKTKLAGVGPLAQAVPSLAVVQSRFGGYHQGFSDGTATVTTYQYILQPAQDCLAARFWFGNWLVGTSGAGTGEAVGLNAIDVAFAVNPISTTNSFNVGTFQGAARITLQPGATVASDPFPYVLRGGASYLLRIRVTVTTAGQKWPLGITTVPALTAGGLAEGSATADNLLSAAMGGNVTTGYHPYQITCQPLAATNPLVGVVGDSIVAGNTGDTVDQGYVRRGLDAAGVPWVRMASGNLTMASLIGAVGSAANYDFHAALAAGVGPLRRLSNFGSNDIAGGTITTLGGMQAQYAQLWAALAVGGAKVYQTTLLARGGLTAAQETLRTATNDWLRTTPSPLAGYVEAADLSETARNSGVQRAGYFADQSHPNATGAAAIGASLTAALFA